MIHFEVNHRTCATLSRDVLHDLFKKCRKNDTVNTSECILLQNKWNHQKTKKNRLTDQIKSSNVKRYLFQRRFTTLNSEDERISPTITIELPKILVDTCQIVRGRSCQHTSTIEFNENEVLQALTEPNEKPIFQLK